MAFGGVLALYNKMAVLGSKLLCDEGIDCLFKWFLVSLCTTRWLLFGVLALYNTAVAILGV